MKENYKKINFWHLAIFICLLIFALATHSATSQKDGFLKVYFLDVGQGDSVFIETPNGNQVLIDGGPDNKTLAELGKIMPFYDRDIDVVLATHKESDHISGLFSVLERYDVKNIIDTKEKGDTAESKAWRVAVEKEKANEIEAIAGRFIDLGNGVELRILYPFDSFVGQKTKNPNEGSVVAVIKYKNNEFLFTGDIESGTEKKIFLSGVNLRADVIKIAHHGSKTSSIEDFLKNVEPQLAMIEVGKNNYGHPSLEVLSRLENLGIKYYRTDTDGMIEIVSDGEKFYVAN